MTYSFKPTPYSSHSLLLRVFPPDGQGRRVLDVGCGNGYIGRFLSERGYQVTGIERGGGYDHEFPPTMELIEADLDYGLPDLQTKFDFVLCADILEHLRSPGELLKQISAVLKNDGVLVASLPNSGNFYFRMQIVMGNFPKHERGLFDRTHLQFYTWSGWAELMQATGFRVRDRVPSAVPFTLVLSQSTCGIVLERISYRIARLWPTLCAYQFVITATPTYG